MSNSSGQYTPEAINHVFAHLHPQDVEQFYTSYRQWLRQYLLADLHAQISTLRQQIVVNNLLMQQAHPSPIALATLARLQSNGVTNLDLLDRMLERGEAWLDNTMLQLEYCEQFDFIRGNYTEWCEHALEGAYDWIDSMHKVQTANNADNASSTATAASTPITPAYTQAGETLNEATEEVFLQKLMSEEDASLIDTAPEIAIVTPASQEETPLPFVDQDTAQMQATGPNAVLQAAQPLAQPLAQHPLEFHTPDDLPAPGDSHQNAPIPIKDEDIIDNHSFEDTIPTKAIVHLTEQDQAAAPIQLDETYAAPSLTTTAPVEHDETSSPTLADTTNASDSTSHISIEEPTGPAELPVPTPPANISNAPVSEKILSPMTGSTAFAATSSPSLSPLSTEPTSVTDQPDHAPRPENYSSTFIPGTSGSTSIPSEPALAPAANQPDYAQAEHTLTPLEQIDTIETSASPHLPLEQIDTIETSATPHVLLDQVESAEQKEAEHKIAEAPVQAEETHPTRASASADAPLPANTEATTTAAEASPDKVSTPALEDATSSLAPAATPTKEISNSPNSSNSPIIPAIPIAELSPSKDTKPAAGVEEQFYTSDDTPWHWNRPSPSETENASLTIPANQASQTSQAADQKSTQPTSTSTSPEHAAPSAPSPTTKSPRKPNFLQILFRVFFSRKPKNPNAK